MRTLRCAAMGPGIARLLLLLAGLLFGMTFIANHELLRVLEAPQITVVRFIGVTVLLNLILITQRQLRPRFSRGEWGLMAASGLLAVPGAQLSLVFGQRFLSPGMSGLVVATGPAFAAALAAIFLRERLSPRQLFGVVLAFSGAATVVLFASGTGTDLTVRNPWGAALVAQVQLCWAGYTVISKHLAANHAPLTAVTVAVTFGTMMMLPAAPGAIAELGGLGTTEWFWLGHLVVLGTVVPYLIWFTSLQHLSANETVVFMFMIPLFALMWSAVLLGEQPALLGLLGGVLIVSGVALTQRLSLRSRWTARAAVTDRPEVQPP